MAKHQDEPANDTIGGGERFTPLRPFRWMDDRWFDPMNEWLKRWALLAILGRLGMAVIVLGVLMYIAEYGDRRQRSVTAAWQLVTAVRGLPGDLGRRQALDALNKRRGIPYLNRRRESLHGIDLSFGYLHRTDLREADLSHADLFGANLHNVGLSGAYLGYADLREAEMDGADLHRTNLDHARVTSSTWIEDQLKLKTPPKGLDADMWHIVEETDEDGSPMFRIRRRPQ